MDDTLMTKYRSVFRTILLLALVTFTGFRVAAAAAPPAYTVTDLGTLGGTGSVGLGINASGQVTGGSDMPGNAYHAFLYDGVMHDLGTLGGFISAGRDINASGHVTGGFGTSGNDNHAFLYDGVMHDLGTLGGTYSLGFRINDSGQVTGLSYTENAEPHAFLYDGTMHDLGTLGGTDSQGRGINASGHVVGLSTTNPLENFRYHAFLYTSDSGMVDLNTFIDPLSGWELKEAWGINDAGQITGVGQIGGQRHAFLLTPVPEPASLALLALALPLLVGRNSRRLGSGDTRSALGPMTVLLNRGSLRRIERSIT
jgi:probable HAF family extracellular repeat protein